MLIKKYSSLIKSFIFLFLYIVVFIAFGFFYQHRAEVTNGDAFSYNEDILLKDKCTYFRYNTLKWLDYSVVKPIFLYEYLDYKKYKSYYISVDNKGEIKNIGKNWGKYYSEKLKYDHFDYITLKFDPENFVFFSQRYIPVEIIAYTVDYINWNEFNIKDERKYSIYISDDSYNELNSWYEQISEISDNQDDLLFIESDCNFSITLFSSSVTYLDNAIDVAQRINNSKFYKYRLGHFMYFSAITITTLGYGDILPNDEFVRILVSIETILGVILIAFFVSYFYDHLKNRSKVENFKIEKVKYILKKHLSFYKRYKINTNKRKYKK